MTVPAVITGALNSKCRIDASKAGEFTRSLVSTELIHVPLVAVQVALASTAVSKVR